MKAQPITVYLPDTRGVEISRYGLGNLKLGFDVFTYSRLPGAGRPGVVRGTCPGSSEFCELTCYAKRIGGPVQDVYARNTFTDEVPPIPDDCKLLRIHVSGDFDTVGYIDHWITRLTERPDVKAWAYTRSWRVPSLLKSLEELRALPNMQLFASMDISIKELPPAGWRRAWLVPQGCETCHRPLDDAAHQGPNGHAFVPQPSEDRLEELFGNTENVLVVPDGSFGYICPEETGRKPNCVSCGYCFDGKDKDVVFLEH